MPEGVNIQVKASCKSEMFVYLHHAIEQSEEVLMRKKELKCMTKHIDTHFTGLALIKSHCSFSGLI